MSDGQLTIWGGPAATGIPTTHPVRTMVRQFDAPTSNGAAVVALTHKADVRKLVVDALLAAGPDGMNDFELAAKIRVKQTHAGKRRLDLFRDGLVARLMVDGLQVCRPSDTGSPSLVWIHVDHLGAAS